MASEAIKAYFKMGSHVCEARGEEEGPGGGVESTLSLWGRGWEEGEGEGVGSPLSLWGKRGGAAGSFSR